jgi:hypothetical protein
MMIRSMFLTFLVIIDYSHEAGAFLNTQQGFPLSNGILEPQYVCKGHISHQS